jgi:hypothetical protein
MLLSCREFPSDLWWTDRGKSFAVNREGFKRHIMSVFFDEHKYRSFQTLLHKYGFRTVSTTTSIETDIIIYQHALFNENDFELSKTIVRVRKSDKPRNQVAAGQQHDQVKPPSHPSGANANVD